MSKDVIVAEQVGKLFSRQKQRTLKELLPAFVTGGKQNIRHTFWALQDVNFRLPEGKSLGIIGPNGSGKSTLMKLIAGISDLTTGKISVHGQIAPLIELGAGFHPELTGRENIYLNSIILGDSEADVDEKIEEIIDFSEIREFIDEPVKHYSSGMYSRLAFAVAIHARFSVLLADEILSVGDAAFRAKCMARMHEFKDMGKTIVLVSHSAAQVTEVCELALYINHGRQVAFGPAAEVTAQYLAEVGLASKPVKR
ncbi:ABC transporter ATP-binding protein [bacterium]|nr:ABC transporter ATP-binding protein [bacterium]